MTSLKLIIAGTFACFTVACTTTVDSEAARDEQLADCQLIQDDEERLECLDEVANGPGANEPAPDPIQ